MPAARFGAMLASEQHRITTMAINLMAQVRADMAKQAKGQLPFVTSLAINRTAVGARDLVRRRLPKKFTLRNSWTQRGIQVRPGTKADPTATVRAPGYMGIQETGGTRKPTRSKLLSAPVAVASSNQVIAKQNRPKALMGGKAFILDMGNGDAGIFLRYGKKRGQIRLLWWLSPDQQYDDPFEFERDVIEEVEWRFGANFVAALMQGQGGKK